MLPRHRQRPSPGSVIIEAGGNPPLDRDHAVGIGMAVEIGPHVVEEEIEQPVLVQPGGARDHGGEAMAELMDQRSGG